MDVSVILCTWNNADRLKITLESFLEMHESQTLIWELILVNNNSTDSTESIVSNYEGRLPIVYVKEKNQGLSHARNAGLRNISGKLVIFTDDDVKPCHDWIRIYWLAYQENPEGFFWGGPIISEFEEPPEDLDLVQLGPCSVKGLDWGRKQKILESGEFFISANWACPAHILKEVGYFNTNLGLNPASGKVLAGEETDLMDRLHSKGLQPLYLPDASIQHFVPKNKITLEHIAARVEALGRARANENDYGPGVKWFGVPRWMLVRLVSLWKSYLLSRLKGRNAYKEYLAYRSMRGNILGLLEARKSNR